MIRAFGPGEPAQWLVAAAMKMGTAANSRSARARSRWSATHVSACARVIAPCSRQTSAARSDSAPRLGERPCWVSQRVDDLVGPVARGLPVLERQGIRVADAELAAWPALPRQRDHLIADVDPHHSYTLTRQLGDGPPGTAADVDHECALGGTQQLVGAGAQCGGAGTLVDGVELGDEGLGCFA